LEPGNILSPITINLLPFERAKGGPGDGGPNAIRPKSNASRFVVGQDARGGTMTQNHQFAILFPLVVGIGAVACTIFVHALALAATINLFRYERKLGLAGAGALIDLAIVALVISFAFVAHLVAIALWAVLLIMCGEFQEFGSAYYHSAVNYTTLGYGDLLLTPSWRLLGPLEATNGVLMFGVSAAMVFAVIQRLVQARFEDLRS
jgi:Ion channel